MNYISAKEAAAKWHITVRRVQFYCANEKIPGAKRIGNQWLLPENTERPADRRYAAARSTESEAPYRFPAFTFTRFYGDSSELSEDEKDLLTAQKQYLAGDPVGCISLCRTLLDRTKSVSVRFGAHWVSCFCFRILGLASEQKSSLKVMESLVGDNEDFRLLLADFWLTQVFDTEPISKIDAEKLSPDALLEYECVSLVAFIFSSNSLSADAVNAHSLLCRNVELQGVTPAAVLLHSALSKICERQGDVEGHHKHIESVCRLCHDEGLLALLSKCSTLSPDEYRRCMQPYGAAFVHQVEQIREMNVKNWKRVYDGFAGKTVTWGETAFENEFCLLLSYGLPNKEIAALKNITEQEVRQLIQKLCARVGVRTKKELTAYFKAFYGGESAEK